MLHHYHAPASRQALSSQQGYEGQCSCQGQCRQGQCRPKGTGSQQVCQGASNSQHTRSQGNFSDPPVRLQHPRLRTEEARFGFHEGRFHCVQELRRKGRPLRLVASSLKESTIPGAGRGLFVREDVPAKTVLAEYGEELITLDEARKRQKEVIALLFRK